jgi:hypothetical protein
VSPPPPQRNAPARAEPKRQDAQPARSAGGGGRATSGSSPQVACDRFSCQPVKKGCSVRTTIFREETQQNVVCN